MTLERIRVKDLGQGPNSCFLVGLGKLPNFRPLVHICFFCLSKFVLKQFYLSWKKCRRKNLFNFIYSTFGGWGFSRWSGRKRWKGKSRTIRNWRPWSTRTSRQGLYAVQWINGWLYIVLCISPTLSVYSNELNVTIIMKLLLLFIYLWWIT